MDYKTIYLCGENFNVPIRVSGVRYVGILGTPKIKIRANSQDDLDAKNISFDNVQLPWQKAPQIEELKSLVEKIFQTGGMWPVGRGKKISSFDQLSRDEKSAALRMVCQGKYTEQQIAFMQLTDDFSSGFALTVDSFCTGGGVGANMIPYKEIKSAWYENGLVCLAKKLIGFSWWDFIRITRNSPSGTSIWVYNREACKKLFAASDYEKIAQFLEVAKTF